MAVPQMNWQSPLADYYDSRQPRLQIITTGWRRLFSSIRPLKTFKRIVSISPSMIVLETTQTISLQKPLLVNLYNCHQQLTHLKVMACRRVDTPTGFQYHLKICLDDLTCAAKNGSLHVLNQFIQQQPVSPTPS